MPSLRKSKRALLIVVLLQIGLLLATTAAAVPVAAGAAAVQTAATPAPGQEPAAGDPTQPAGTPTPGPQSSTVTQIFEVVFSADTLSKALSTAIAMAAGNEIVMVADQLVQVTSTFSEILSAPGEGEYALIAGSSLPTAAALAPVLFALRLAFYHWQRLLGAEDSLLQVIGDWLASAFFAAAAGPFLDLLVQTGWWMALSAIGEPALLAGDFLSVTTSASALTAFVGQQERSLFTALFWLGGAIGGLVGAIGLAFAFAVAQAVLFVLAVLGPAVAILGVLQPARWLRTLWFKAAAVLCLVPVAAGGIFKASVALAANYWSGSFTDLIIRIFWLWGAVGFMLSLAGILGKMTLSTTTDTAARLAATARSLISTAVLAGSGSAGAAAIGLQAARTNGQGEKTPVAGGGGSQPAAPPPYSLAASGRNVPDYGFSSSANAAIAGHTRHSPESFSRGLAQLAGYFTLAGLDAQQVVEAHPEDAARMVNAFLKAPEKISAAPSPLLEAARLGGAHSLGANIRDMRPGEPAE